MHTNFLHKNTTTFAIFSNCYKIKWHKDCIGAKYDSYNYYQIIEKLKEYVEMMKYFNKKITNEETINYARMNEHDFTRFI